MEKNQIYESKYKEFADKFEALCDEFAAEDFNAEEIKKVCEDIIDHYAE
jgi:DNA-binding transcriptional regulator YhcF (GntR family)